MLDFNRSSLIISLVLIIIISGLGILNFAGVNIPYLNWVEKGVFNIISPILNLTSGVFNFFKGYWDCFLDTNKIREEKKLLNKRIIELKLENLNLQGMARENERLKKLLVFKEAFVQFPFSIVGARVTGLSPHYSANRLIINKGSNHGLELKMPVITYNGILVGKIDYLGSNSAQVMMINDPDFVIGGIVERESRAIGVVRGQAGQQMINIMDKIPWDADIQVGDLILSSGLVEGSFPKGLPIGRVIEVKTDNYGVSQKASIELFINLKTVKGGTIEEVVVLTNF